MKAAMLLLAARAASLARPFRVLGRRGVAVRSGDGEAAWPEATLAKIAAGAGTPAALAALKAELAVAGDAPDAAYGACFPFPLDAFQRDALRSLRADRNVIVSAPTGSGKTVAGELAIAYALSVGKRVFYTTPLKALSNQKFCDFCAQFGPGRVGLSTGDSGVRRDAAVVVMTTEVFRNMIYDDAGRAEIAEDVFAVVFDEFHYMNDAQRGTVWEESVVGCPESARIVALSATVSNARSVAGWMASIHGPTDVVETDFRPVPLRYEFAGGGAVVPLFRSADVGPGSETEARERARLASTSSGGTRARARKRLQLNPALDKPREKPKRVGRDRFDRRGGKFDEGAMPSREILKNLQKRDRLPAIFFVFSRKGCENEAAHCGSLQLLDVDEETRARQRIRAWALENEDVARLDSERERVDLLTRGVAAHHAGLLPQYKTLVEELFRDGLVKACFATETLAAGVNLPARTTVVTSLVKRGDDGMEPLTTSALLQMAGRAGRRGKDAAGTVVVARGRKFGDRDAGLARRVLLSDVLPIASKFAPSYGVACALLRGGDLERCRAVVERSFGSYLANRNSPRKRTPPEEPLCGGLAEGVLRDYTVLLAAAGDACDAFEAARALDDDRALEDARRALRAAQGAVLASPVSQLAPDKQLEALEAYGALKAANEAPRPPVELPAPDAPRPPSPAWRRFETLVGVLERFGAVEAGAPTALGDLVASVNGDNELLLATCLLDDATLDVATNGSPAEVAALFSAFVCEIGDRRGVFVDYGPSAKVRDATDALFERAVLPLSDLQFEAGLGDVACRLDDAAAGLVESWADGAAWAQVKDATSLDHGDLIRLFRRTLDVLKTAANLDPALAPPSFAAVRSAARAAAKAVDRPPVRDDQFDAIFVRDDDGGDGEDDPKDP